MTIMPIRRNPAKRLLLSLLLVSIFITGCGRGRDEYGMMIADLRGLDHSGSDYSQSLAQLLSADFDTRTKWPPQDRMPAGFDPQQIMELGKNPGLGIRALHTQGITGRGVGIAIIDQPLLADHQEYADRLRMYEILDDVIVTMPSMHGPAVASIAVGQTIGVAPEADLYYIATLLGNPVTREQLDFSYLARGIRRILTVNQQLPPDRRIRVISIAIGWGSGDIGYAEVQAAAQEAKAAGLLVICSSTDEVHGFKFNGLGRMPLADPDSFTSYEPGLFWANDFRAKPDRFSGALLVPMDSRTSAAPDSPEGYAFYRAGGWSWSIPYIAGVYALAAQVKPSITPDEFWTLAMNTGRTIQLTSGNQTRSFGPMLDPSALFKVLQEK